MVSCSIAVLVRESLVLEADSTDRIGLAEGSRGTLSFALDIQGHEENYWNEQAQCVGEEGGVVDIEANSAAVDGDYTSECLRHLLDIVKT